MHISAKYSQYLNRLSELDILDKAIGIREFNSVDDEIQQIDKELTGTKSVFTFNTVSCCNRAATRV